MGVISQIIKNGGIDPSYYDRTARAESGGRSNAKNPNSSASGLYQFTKGTWRTVVDKYGLKYTDADRFDKNKSREVMEFFTRDNAEQLKSYGIKPNNTDLYTAHFMGVGGARKLLATQRENPNASVYDVATPAQIKANKSVFLHKDGTPKTVGQVYEILGDKINKTHNYATNYKKTEEYKNKYPEINSTTPLPQISNFDNPLEGINFTEETPKEDNSVIIARMELQQKQNEENLFNDLLKASQLQYVDPNQAEIPQQEYQNGGVVKDDRGYWNPDNWGKAVEINSNIITMEGVKEPLYIVPDVGQPKVLFPNQNYTFPNATKVVEYPLKTKNKRFS